MTYRNKLNYKSRTGHKKTNKQTKTNKNKNKKTNKEHILCRLFPAISFLSVSEIKWLRISMLSLSLCYGVLKMFVMATKEESLMYQEMSDLN